MGSGGRVARLLAQSPNHRAAKNKDWGFGLHGECECEGEEVVGGICL